jgi:transposase
VVLLPAGVGEEVGPPDRTACEARAVAAARPAIEAEDRPVLVTVRGRAVGSCLSWSERGGSILHVGLDLSRRRVEVCVISSAGEVLARFRAPVDRDGLHGLVRRVEAFGGPVRAVVESMNGARFVYDELTGHGWRVLVADAQKVKGLAPLACKSDTVDARVLAELSVRDLVPAIWLPTPEVRAERERARYRLHLVKHRSILKNRIHSTLIAHGHPVVVSDLFGAAGRWS